MGHGIGRHTIILLILLSPLAFAENHSQVLIDDVSRLNPTYVKEVAQYDSIESLQDALERARNENLKVSIAGKRHSMGGHTFYPGGVVLDMTEFNNVLAIDPETKTILVQSGATWKDVIEAANPHNLSVEVMQAYNVFTIGGSMSVSVHESDPHFGPSVESVNSFRLLLANGTVVNVSRTENAELFSLANGGYGLFGIILDANLSLTDNHILKKKEYIVDYKDYYATFQNLFADPNVEIIFARLSIVPGKTLLRETIVTTYEITNTTDPSHFELADNSNVKLKRFIFGLSRDYTWGKSLRWFMQKKFSDLADPAFASRNNIMNGNVHYLDYNASRNTDILQEYFVPVENLPAFLDGLRATVEKHDLNLLSATIRYIPRNTDALLSYSRETVFGVVLYFNVGTSDEEQKEAEQWTQELIDVALANEGTYYLPYKLYATKEQIRKAYPMFDEFVAKKKKYDPQELFTNKFYEKYK